MSKAAVIQMNSCAAIGPNLLAVKRLAAKAVDQGAKLIVLPENFALFSGKTDDYLISKEILGEGRIQDFIANLARSLKVWVVAGTIPLFCEYAANKVYAASIVYDANGKQVAVYYKMHLFDVVISKNEAYGESEYAYPGDRAVVVDTPIGKLGLSVCYDLRFPSLYQKLLDLGAEIFILPSAFTAKTGSAHWEALIKVRAIENQCFLLAANQFGYHQDSGRMTYGHSAIINPWGEILTSCEFGEEVACADLSLIEMYELREKFPVISHRRFETGKIKPKLDN